MVQFNVELDSVVVTCCQIKRTPSLLATGEVEVAGLLATAFAVAKRSRTSQVVARVAADLSRLHALAQEGPLVCG